MIEPGPTTPLRPNRHQFFDGDRKDPTDLSDLANADARISIQRKSVDDSQTGSSEKPLTDSYMRAEWAGQDDADSVRIFLGSRPTASVGLLKNAPDNGIETTNGVIRVSNWGPVVEKPSLFRWYRSHLVGGEPSDFFAIVTIEFDDPNHNRQENWINQLVTAISAEPEPIPGLVAAHFLTSIDGTQVINIANWASESEYDRALANGPAGIAQNHLPEWQRVINSPGVASNTIDRCTLIESAFSIL